MKTGTVLMGLGVVGLGVLGTVILSKKTGEVPAPQNPKPGTVPTPPVPLSDGAGLVFVDGPNSVHLRQSQYYRGRLLLGSSGLLNLPPFNAGASEETIGKGLVALGFVDVRVYMNVSDLPGNWPKETALNTAAGTRWFQGQWTGSTADVPRPPQLERMWVTASPALVAARTAQAIAVSGVGSVMSG